MSGFTSFIAAFCTACVLLGGLTIISPDGAMSKPIKYVFSLIFILAIIAAASITIKQADFDLSSTPAITQDNEEMSVAAAEYVYGYALSSAKINFTKITVCTDKNEDGSIIISKVIIHSDSNPAEIMTALGDVAQNYEVEIINE